MLGELCGLDLLLVSMHGAVGLLVLELFPKSSGIHSISSECQLCSPGLAECRREINSKICCRRPKGEHAGAAGLFHPCPSPRAFCLSVFPA